MIVSFFILILASAILSQLAFHMPAFVTKLKTPYSKTSLFLIRLSSMAQNFLDTLYLPSKYSLFVTHPLSIQNRTQNQEDFTKMVPVTYVDKIFMSYTLENGETKRTKLIDYSEMSLWQKLKIGHRRNIYTILFNIPPAQPGGPSQPGLNTQHPLYNHLITKVSKDLIDSVIKQETQIKDFINYEVHYSHGAHIVIPLQVN